jgi:hypothetical protein
VIFVRDIVDEPAGSVHRALIASLAGPRRRLLLVEQPQNGLGADGQRFLETLTKYLVGSGLRTEWPGTRLIGGPTALVHEFEFTEVVISAVLRGPSSLYSWVQPDWPEIPA